MIDDERRAKLRNDLKRAKIYFDTGSHVEAFRMLCEVVEEIL